MSTTSDVIQVIAAVVPAIGKLAAALIALGKSPNEAARIIRRDILTRSIEYERDKAADDAALEDKHGRS